MAKTELLSNCPLRVLPDFTTPSTERVSRTPEVGALIDLFINDALSLPLASGPTDWTEPDAGCGGNVLLETAVVAQYFGWSPVETVLNLYRKAYGPNGDRAGWEPTIRAVATPLALAYLDECVAPEGFRFGIVSGSLVMDTEAWWANYRRIDPAVILAS